MKKQESHVAPLVRNHEDAERRWFYGGGLHLWKATSAETGGAFWLMEDVLTRGKTTPLHRHAGGDEIVYLVEGEILFSIDGVEHRLGPGGVARVPRGTPHAFLVTSETARLLVFGTWGRTEEFFRAASEPAPTPHATGPVDFERVRAAGVSTGAMDVLGPPPFPRG
jgi:quercetin dioxygenase-like cupin family protein